MPQTEHAQTSHEASVGEISVYSSAFEVQLEKEDFGKSRREHNEMCNLQLLALLDLLEQEGDSFSTDISNQQLIELIQSNMKGSPGPFVWEHCSSSKADGRLGVMRLVPKDQHDPKSEFWQTIHPDHKSRGGYHEWAIPAGAPTALPAKYRKELRGIKISGVDAITQSDQLLPHFKKAVLTNNLDYFQRSINKAKEICSSDQLDAILTQNMGTDIKHKDTLIHRAAASGYIPLLNQLLSHVKNPLACMNAKNHKGDTPAHVAAQNNRARAVVIIKLSGANFEIKNNKGLTVAAVHSHQMQYFPYAGRSCSIKPAVDRVPEKASAPVEKNYTKAPVRDPQFVYSGTMRRSDSVPVSPKQPSSDSATTAKIPLQPTNVPVSATKPVATTPPPSIKTPVHPTVSPALAKPFMQQQTIKPVFGAIPRTTPAQMLTKPQFFTSRPVSAAIFRPSTVQPIKQSQVTQTPKVQCPLKQPLPPHVPRAASVPPSVQRPLSQPQRFMPQRSQSIRPLTQQHQQNQQTQQRAQQERARQMAQRQQQERARQQQLQQQVQRRAQQEPIRQMAQQQQEQARRQQLQQQQAQQRAQQERARQIAQQQQQERARQQQLQQQQAQQRAQQERVRQAQLAALQRAQQERTRQLAQQQRSSQQSQQASRQRTSRR